MTRSRCPSPVTLERAFWSRDAELQAHADECARCGREWSSIGALAAAARAIQPKASSPERREEIRTTLLAALSPAPRAEEPPVAARPLWRRWPVVVPAALAAAAAVAVAVRAWDRSPAGVPAPRAAGVDQPRPARRGNILAHDGARYLLAAPSPDEIVRLVDGTFTIEVESLRAGERFRVITGDAEVEVKGTAFDVTARADRLTSVRVIHGLVEVRRAGDQPVLLAAGQRWDAPLPAPATVPAPPQRAPAKPEAASVTAPIPPAQPARDPAQEAFDTAWTAMRNGEFAAAATAFERAAALQPDGPLAEDSAYWRSVALARAGRALHAIDAFQSFLTSYPSSPRAGEASVILGWLLFDRGETARAATLFRSALADPSPRIRERAAEGLAAAEPRP